MKLINYSSPHFDALFFLKYTHADVKTPRSSHAEIFG